MLFSCADIHGINLNCSTFPQAMTELEELVKCNRGDYVCFFESNLFRCALKDETVCKVINQAALVYPDGIGPTLSARWLTGVDFARIPGPSFMLAACEYGLTRHWRHFFFGGKAGVAEKLADVLKAKYPGLEVAGTYTPPFRPMTDAEEQEVKRKIEDSQTTLLWVGLGGPKQEFWMQAHQGKINVPVMLGVGAAFDFHSGNRPWAPQWIRRIGLEWLYRTFSGGFKTFTRNVKCVSLIAVVLGWDFLCCKLLCRSKTTLTEIKSKQSEN